MRLENPSIRSRRLHEMIDKTQADHVIDSHSCLTGVRSRGAGGGGGGGEKAVAPPPPPPCQPSRPKPRKIFILLDLDIFRFVMQSLLYSQISIPVIMSMV